MFPFPLASQEAKHGLHHDQEAKHDLYHNGMANGGSITQDKITERLFQVNIFIISKARFEEITFLKDGKK